MDLYKAYIRAANCQFIDRSVRAPIYHYFRVRAVASLTVPGGQNFHFPHFSSHFDKFDLFFPQNFLIFFLTLALRVGDSPTRDGSGYATDAQK